MFDDHLFVRFHVDIIDVIPEMLYMPPDPWASSIGKPKSRIVGRWHPAHE
jgi:hypothetical protein